MPIYRKEKENQQPKVKPQHIGRNSPYSKYPTPDSRPWPSLRKLTAVNPSSVSLIHVLLKFTALVHTAVTILFHAHQLFHIVTVVRLPVIDAEK